MVMLAMTRSLSLKGYPTARSRQRRAAVPHDNIAASQQRLAACAASFRYLSFVGRFSATANKQRFLRGNMLSGSSAGTQAQLAVPVRAAMGKTAAGDARRSRELLRRIRASRITSSSLQPFRINDLTVIQR